MSDAQPTDLSKEHILCVSIGGGFSGHTDSVDYALGKFPPDLYAEVRDVFSRVTNPEIYPTLPTDETESDVCIDIKMCSKDGTELKTLFDGYFKPTPLIVTEIVTKLLNTESLQP